MQLVVLRRRDCRRRALRRANQSKLLTPSFTTPNPSTAGGRPGYTPLPPTPMASSTVRWRTTDDGATALQWELPPPLAADVWTQIQAALAPPTASATANHVDGGEDEGGDADAEGVPRLSDAATASDATQAALRGRHSLRIRLAACSPAIPSPTCITLGLSLGSGRVYWESPLQAMQRAQGIVRLHSPGRDDGACWRLPPLTLQSLVVVVLSPLVQGAQLPTLVHSKRGRGGDAAAMAVHARGLLTDARHTAASAAAAADSAGADFSRYAAATAALGAMAARVAAGGPLWTREEQLAKLSRLEMMASLALHKAHEGLGCGAPHVALTEGESALLAALEAGRRDLGMVEVEAEEGVGVAGHHHGHGHGH